MVKRILILGGKGMLAQALTKELSGEIWAPGKEELDVTDDEAVETALERFQPQVVINASAFTKVDLCEVETEKALKVNVEAVGKIAGLCQKTGAFLVHISTDYVFDGKERKPYPEDALAHPLSFYGKTKYLGEQQAKICPHHLIIRVSWLFGEGKPNFVTFVKERLEQGEKVYAVTDQVSRPSYTRDVAKAIGDAIARDVRGTLHIANDGFCTRFDQAKKVAEYLHLPQSLIIPIKTEELFQGKAPRPPYSVLDLTKTERVLGYRLPPWEDALRRYLEGIR